MTSKEIIYSWCDEVLRSRKANKVFPNIFIDRFEADILEVTKSGYFYEYEVKVSRSDFKNEDKKKSRGFYYTKRDKFKEMESGERVNFFSYIVPKGLISVEEVPDYAGLIYASEYETSYTDWESGKFITKKRVRFDMVKAPTKLSKEKYPGSSLEKLLESTYYRFHNQRLKNEK